jgi:tetratricopeptide (TPR) repeat protein
VSTNDDDKNAVKEQTLLSKLKELRSYVISKENTECPPDTPVVPRVTRHKAILQYNDGVLKFKKGDISGAIEEFLEAIRIDPSSRDSYFNLGEIYLQLEQFDKGIYYSTKAIECNSHDSRAYNNRGMGYGNTNQLQLAIQDFNQAIQLDDQFAMAYFNRGLMFYEFEQLDLAFKDWNKFLKLDPNSEKAIKVRKILNSKKSDNKNGY